MLPDAGDGAAVEVVAETDLVGETDDETADGDGAGGDESGEIDGGSQEGEAGFGPWGGVGSGCGGADWLDEKEQQETGGPRGHAVEGNVGVKIAMRSGGGASPNRGMAGECVLGEGRAGEWVAGECVMGEGEAGEWIDMRVRNDRFWWRWS